jgi:hypothetical protein
MHCLSCSETQNRSDARRGLVSEATGRAVQTPHRVRSVVLGVVVLLLIGLGCFGLSAQCSMSDGLDG